MAAGFERVRVSRVHTWTEGLRTIQLDFVPERFEPGQFFQLALERDGTTIKRSYSAASAPGAPLEFFVSEVPNGELTPSLFRLEAGDEVRLDTTALGFFTLSEVPEADVLWLVATGTGLGPWIAMLRQGDVLTRFRRVCVVQSVRTLPELAYASELAGFVERGLVHVPLTSRDEAPPHGLGGRVTSALASGALEERAGSPVDASGHYLLCGNPQMIEDMAALLKARGLKKHRRREPGHFNYEKYW